MRITVSLEDDVAAVLGRLQQERRTSVKRLVNEALRRGLGSLAGQGDPRKPFRTRSVSLGRCLVGDVVDVAGVLAFLDGELSEKGVGE